MSPRSTGDDDIFAFLTAVAKGTATELTKSNFYSVLLKLSYFFPLLHVLFL